jgi:tetratricopeptide (TPR) repeat protein
MSEHLEYIDSYFQKQLSEAEKEKFEQLCVSDEKFASEVAFYITSRSALNDLLLGQKKEQWSKFPISENEEAVKAPVRTMAFRKWLPYAAAASLIIALLAAPWFSSDSPKKNADKYASEHLIAISQTMDASRDSLQLGIASFNKKEYDKALAYFQGVYNSYPSQRDALRYAGQTQLMQGKFDEAIASFDELSQKKTYSNPGLFLKAIALLRRNHDGDARQAKEILQKVADLKLDGSKEAAGWLKDWSDK